jgi:hypothetical protein
MIGGLYEAISDGISGWLFHIGDQVALSKRMRSAMAAKMCLEKMGNTGRDSILRDFTVEKMVVESESVLMQSVPAI